MINDNLKKISVSIEDIYLDPNNPRFWSEKSDALPEVADKKTVDVKIQAIADDNLSGHDVENLKNSMLRNGFLTLDRVVVRKLEGIENKYVVIEGNRRISALKTLREQIEDETIAEDGIDEEYLERLFKDTNVVEVLEYTGDDAKDIAWLLQGVRHISGIKEWDPAQQGKLVCDQIDREGLKFTEAGQKFGLSAQKVGRRYRSYKALVQMREDDEYQSKADNKYYSLFEAAIARKDVKTWLGWSDESSRFENDDNLMQFYSWIVPDEDNEGVRRIHDPKHIKILGDLLSADHKKLISKIDQFETTIEAAAQIISESEASNINETIEGVLKTLGDLTYTAIQTNTAPKETIKLLTSLTETAKKLLEDTKPLL